MEAIFLAACIAGGNFMVAAALHLICCRMVPRLDRLALLVRALVAALASTVVTTYFVGETIEAAVRSAFVTSAIALASVAFCIFVVAALSFYSAITHSVRLRIATLVSQAPGARQLVDEVVARYDAEEATRCRVQQMLDGGYLAMDGDFLQLTPKGAFVAAISAGGKRFFKVGLGG